MRDQNPPKETECLIDREARLVKVPLLQPGVDGVEEAVVVEARDVESSRDQEAAPAELLVVDPSAYCWKSRAGVVPKTCCGREKK